MIDHSANARRAKLRAFATITQDGDEAWCARLHDLPTPEHAEVIRAALGIRGDFGRQDRRGEYALDWGAGTASAASYGSWVANVVVLAVAERNSLVDRCSIRKIAPWSDEKSIRVRAVSAARPDAGCIETTAAAIPTV
jgi:hypothetical protein